jgi:hypothetical protein
LYRETVEIEVVKPRAGEFVDPATKPVGDVGRFERAAMSLVLSWVQTRRGSRVTMETSLFRIEMI